MSNSHTMYARLCAIFFVLLFSSVAFGGATKVDVCHIPPDDPDNFHTIRISEKALPSHLKHGDLEGACEVDPEVECPCFSQADLDALGAASCLSTTTDQAAAFDSGVIACSGDGSAFSCGTSQSSLTPGCGYIDNVANVIVIFENISTEENATCLLILSETCTTVP